MASHHSKYALRGRRHECESLDRVLEDAQAGRSRVLVLRGEAGIGSVRWTTGDLPDHKAALIDERLLRRSRPGLSDPRTS